MRENGSLHADSPRLVTVPAADLAAASQRLDPASRALLNLWVRRGMGDDEIARLIGSTPAGVATRREALVERLAAELERTPEDVRAAVESMASRAGPEENGARAEPAGDEEASATRAPAPDGVDEAVEKHPVGAMPPGENPMLSPTVPPPGVVSASEQPPPPDWARAGPSTRLTTLVIVVLVVASLALLLTALLAGSDSPPASSRPAPTQARSGPGPPAPRLAAVALRPLSGASRATGTATVRRSGTTDVVELAVSGLPRRPGRYEAWLFNSILDSRALGPVAAPAGRLTAPLPANRARYRFLDVSLQPSGRRVHSGLSVLRARLL